MPKRGEPANEAQRAAAQRNLAKGQKVRNERREAMKDHESAGERWARLLSGQLTVKDLDDDEIEKMRVRGKGGGFDGRPRAIPSHLAKQFAAEQQKRLDKQIRDLVPDAIRALEEIIKDDENPQRAKMVQYTIDRVLGKTPETLRVDAGSDWDRVAEAVVVDRGVADGAESFLADAVDRNDGQNSQ